MWKPSPPPSPPPLKVPRPIPESLSSTVPKATTTSVQRRPVPPTRLTSEDLRDYSDDEIDDELKHLALPFSPDPTTKIENNKMIV